MNILKWFRKILQSLQGCANKEFVYVAMGDSTVEGIGASTPDKTVPSIIHKSLLQTHKNVAVYNLGTGGARTKDVIKKQLNKAIELEPSLITISIGANDVMYGKTLFKFKKELKFLLHELRNRTDAKIVINNIPDFSAAVRIPQPIRWIHCLRTKKFNKGIYEICQQFGVTHVDIHTTTKLFSKNYREFISNDRLHPSDTGYAIWANTILSHIDTLTFNTNTNFLPK